MELAIVPEASLASRGVLTAKCRAEPLVRLTFGLFAIGYVIEMRANGRCRKDASRPSPLKAR
jgi:hypothetical protein